VRRSTARLCAARRSAPSLRGSAATRRAQRRLRLTDLLAQRLVVLQLCAMLLDAHGSQFIACSDQECNCPATRRGPRMARLRAPFASSRCRRSPCTTDLELGCVQLHAIARASQRAGGGGGRDGHRTRLRRLRR
jgi:hypothetical protein